MGAFCVAIFGVEDLAQEYKDIHDEYNAIMAQAIGDRFAEAFAEYLHKQIRIKHWGYGAHENLKNDELIKEAYTGIRPAPGYPACPDHLEKDSIFELLDVEKIIGVKLTESRAMWPASAVSGYYFAHPESKYFGLGKITEEQVSDYAQRKGISIQMAMKWLQPNLSV
jgi:5-methyltetrahydrofolate--homocysteine methyltransferase